MNRFPEINSWKIKDSRLNWRVKLKPCSTLRNLSINWLFPFILLIHFEKFARFPRWAQPSRSCGRKYAILVCPKYVAKFISKYSENFREIFWKIWNFLVKMAKFLEIWKDVAKFENFPWKVTPPLPKCNTAPVLAS